MSQPRPARAILVALVAALSLYSQNPSGDRTFSASPKALQDAFNALHPPQDTHVVVLLEEAEYSFDANGANTYRHRLVFKALTRAGADGWAMIERSWAKWHEKKPEIRARVISADGTVHVLDQKTVADSAARDDGTDVLSDARRVRAPLPAMAPGSIVEQEVIIRETAPISKSGATFRFYFGASVPTERTHLVMKAPAGLPLRHVVQGLPGAKVTSRKLPGGGTEIVVDHGPMEPNPALPSLLPPEMPRTPYVAFSTGSDWGTAATEYSRIVERQLAGWKATSYLPAFDASASREDKIRLIVQKLNADVRYTGVEFGDAAIVPRSPGEVLTRKYGDCKDKSTLLVALLRAVGIDAHVALLRASSSGHDIDPDLPGLNVFNHAIVYVPGEPRLWIDPTDRDARVGVIAPSDQGRLALVARDTTTALLRTTEATSEQNRIVEKREFQLAEIGPAQVTETSELWGAFDDEYRDSVGRVEFKKLQEHLKSYGEWTYASPEEPVFSRSDPDDLANPFRLRAEFKKAARGTSTVSEAAVGVVLSQVAIRLPEFFRTAPDQITDKKKKEAEAKRTADFVIPKPYRSEWHYRIVAPPGFALRKLPDPVDEKLGPATLSVRFQAEKDGVVKGLVRFDVPKRRFTATEGFALRDAVLSLQKRPNAMVQYTQIGETLLSTGKVKEALAAFGELQRLHPNEALHCAQRARALLAAGAGDAAREEAQRGVRLEPKSAKAYVDLATVLKHDLVGRYMKKGYDRAAAIAAYRKAAELDPSDHAIRANLAILLEHDEYGERYSVTGAQLDEAIAEYRKVESKLADLGVGSNLVVAMFRAEKMKDVLDYLRDKPDTDIHRSLKLAAIAVLNGPAAAIETATRDVAGVSQQRKALLAAGQNLLMVRRYAAASELYAAGAAEAANPAGTQNLAEILKRTVRAEQLSLNGSKPEDLVKRFFQTIISGDYRKPEKLAQVYSRHMMAGINPDEVKDVERGLGTSRAQIAKAGMTFQTAWDVTFAMMRISSEGDAESGYVLRANTPSPGGQQTSVFYVIREDGEYRILGCFGVWEGVARYVLALADAGKFELARKWLDRAREEIPLGTAQDPLSPPMFPRIWTKGQNADKTRIQWAAAVLLSGASKDNVSIPILNQARKRAQTEQERRAFTAVLISSLRRSRAHQKAADLAAELFRAVPDSPAVFTIAADTAARTLDRARVEPLVMEKWKRFESDTNARVTAINALLSVGSSARLNEIVKYLMDRGKVGSAEYNNFAWSHLVAGTIGPDTEEALRQAMSLSNSAEPSVLHTLAAVQAETGKPEQARVTILQRMQIAGSDEPDSEDWYVFGRIAEDFGLPEVAKKLYARVTRPKDDSQIPGTSYGLAQRRLAVLGAAAQTDGAAAR